MEGFRADGDSENEEFPDLEQLGKAPFTDTPQSLMSGENPGIDSPSPSREAGKTPVAPLVKRRRLEQDDTQEDAGTPSTPHKKRLLDNGQQSDQEPPASSPAVSATKSRDPSQGIFSGLSAAPYPATAGSTGMLGREEQERVTGIKATAIAPPNSQEDKAYNENLMQVAKVFTFRNMSVSIDDLMFVCIEPGIERTYKFQVLMVKINKWSSGWQGKMWGSQSWLQHVRNHVVTFNKLEEPDKNGYGKDTPYDRKSPKQKLDFWTQRDRFTLQLVLSIFRCLKKAIDITAIWQDRTWKIYVAKMVASAANSTWNYRMRYADGVNGAMMDHLQTYQEIRSAPEQLAADRPAVSQVPTHGAEFLGVVQRDDSPPVLSQPPG